MNLKTAGSISSQTLKGALIGAPVSYSISHLVYPSLFKEMGIVGFFEKIEISPKELRGFFLNRPELDFITVTMPHKEAVIPFMDSLTEEAKAIGSVNYIAVKEGKLLGCNFDGVGGLNVIEEVLPVLGKSVVVIGAGGAGKAAVYESKKRGAKVTIVNRTREKGQSAAAKFGVDYASGCPLDFDVLINATSIGMDRLDQRELVSKEISFEKKVVLDMASRTGDCLLQKKVTKNNGVYIAGSSMFLNLTKAGLLFLTEPTHYK